MWGLDGSTNRCRLRAAASRGWWAWGEMISFVSVDVVISTDRVALPLRRPSFADLAGLFTPWDAAPVSDGQLVVLNEALAVELGLDVEALRTPTVSPPLVGQRVPTAR